jgi:hypothetical protein
MNCFVRFFFTSNNFFHGLLKVIVRESTIVKNIRVSLCHGGGWSKKINAWYLNTLMVYL